MTRLNAEKVARIVRDAGGRVIGRTRLQKIAYLLTAAELENGLLFRYRHYGPYSDDLANGAWEASLLGLVMEEERLANWGAVYSVYSVPSAGETLAPSARKTLSSLAANADAVELELAATALFLARQGYDDPWKETARRKPDKAAEGRIARAKVLYNRLRAVPTPAPLPPIIPE